MKDVAFQRWLVDVGYREATAIKTAQAVAHVQEHFARTSKVPGRLSRPTVLALGKLVRFAPKSPFARALVQAGIEPVEPKPMPRRAALERRSLGDDEWRRVLAELDKSTRPEHLVLRFMSCTGLRIGETLGLDIGAIDRALHSEKGLLFLERKGGHRKAIPIQGARESLAAIAQHFDRRRFDRICQWVCSSAHATPLAPGAAYQRCRRAFRALGVELEVDGRLNLHRIRRTVAVQALRLSRDVKAVQDLLGQESPKSTQHYLDELRELDVAQLQEDLRTFRQEKPR